jgi:hypothetical protein
MKKTQTLSMVGLGCNRIAETLKIPRHVTKRLMNLVNGVTERIGSPHVL